MTYNRNDREQVKAIADKLHSMQENEKAPYDIDEILRKLDIEVIEGNPNGWYRENELPILERVSENFFKLYIPKHYDKWYVYYKKVVGLMLYLFNNLNVGEKLTNFDLAENKNKLNDNILPVICEFMIPANDLKTEMMQPSIIKNPMLLLSKMRTKYGVPTSLATLRMMQLMKDTKQQMKEDGVDMDALMEEMKEVEEEFRKMQEENEQDEQEESKGN